MEADFALKPEWRDCVEGRPERDPDTSNLNAWPNTEAEAEAWVIYSIENYGCPFAWLLDDWIAP